MFVQCFNECIGAISDFTGVPYEPEKGVRCYNIKTALFNLATVTLVYGIALMLFADPLVGLVISSLSFAAKAFIHIAMDKTFLGLAFKDKGNFFFKSFMTL
jgi:hypothetical protein